MKTLTNAEIIQIVENCYRGDEEEIYYCMLNCPLSRECRYWFTHQRCGSVLEKRN